MVDGTPHHYGVTTPREVLLEKLVVSLHLNVPERRMLGSDSVSIEEVAAAREAHASNK
jgi:hypothetical protein